MERGRASSTRGFRALKSPESLTRVLTGVRAMIQVFPLERAAEAYDLMMSGSAEAIKGVFGVEGGGPDDPKSS